MKLTSLSRFLTLELKNTKRQVKIKYFGLSNNKCFFFLWKNCDFRQVEKIPGGRGRGSRSLNPKPRFITETIYVQIFSS